MYYEHHNCVESAIAREKQIKNWKRQWRLALIESVNPKWEDLFSSVAGSRVEHGMTESDYESSV